MMGRFVMRCMMVSIRELIFGMGREEGDEDEWEVGGPR